MELNNCTCSAIPAPAVHKVSILNVIEPDWIEALGNLLCQKTNVAALNIRSFTANHKRTIYPSIIQVEN